MACCNCGGDGRCHSSVHYSAHGIVGNIGSAVFDSISLSSCEDCGSMASSRGDCAHCGGSGHCGC
jgi:hypothetical protein